jgi:hypothetical protein
MSADIDGILDGIVIDGPDAADSVPGSRRPALIKLTTDIESLVDDLETGFNSRASILRWARSSITKTLGEVPTSWYGELSAQFRGVRDRDGERVLLEALLVENQRTLDLDQDAVDELKRRIAIEVLEPAFHSAFRSLRNDATEYVDSDGSSETEHEAHKQSFIAMRPYLSETDRYQRVAVGTLLDGLDDAGEIRRWGAVLEHATHGEIPQRFVKGCLCEPSTRSLLTESDPTVAQERARELFAAHHLLPAFNRGVRDLRSRSKEEADAEYEQKEVPSI